jgi:hypothetical protein
VYTSTPTGDAAHPQQYAAHEGYCCSIVFPLCCYEIQLYPHMRVSPAVCCSKQIRTLALCCCCCVSLDRFSGSGLFTPQEALNNLELQEAVFAQTPMSRTCPLFCMSKAQNAKFFSIVEAKNLNVYPHVCCYQIFGYAFF